MDRKVTKFSVEDSKPIAPNKTLRLPADVEQDPWLRQPQRKATDSFQKTTCTTFLGKKFPGLKCDGEGGKASAEANDKVENLTNTWIAEDDIVRDLSSLPTSGKTKMPLWSDEGKRVGKAPKKISQRHSYPRSRQ